jgi:SSS family solute:Na+ symporter
MKAEIDSTALAVFLFFFALVTIMGFLAARWRRPATLAHLDEWGLGGRQFGTWITWFLIGGDFYTAYTVIAVIPWERMVFSRFLTRSSYIHSSSP